MSLPWIRCWPVPIVRARLNGQPVLLAVGTGLADLVLDPPAARRCGVTVPTGQVPIAWGADLWRHGVRRDALLSSDFLRRQRVTIDWERRELVFE